MAPAGRILVGEIGRPHGVRGLVKLRSFTADPTAIASYGPLTDEAGTRRFAIALLADGLARVEGVDDRDAAARLTGTPLYVERASLPPPDEDEFYLADLVGLRAETAAGEPLGRVRSVEDNGAGAFLVLDGPPGSVSCPSPAPACRWWTPRRPGWWSTARGSGRAAAPGDEAAA
jgi:16S rRNA processing protein RimM